MSFPFTNMGSPISYQRKQDKEETESQSRDGSSNHQSSPRSFLRILP